MNTPLWVSKEAALATGGELKGKAWSAYGVSIDTRSLVPGDLFVALKDMRDGHDFVADALSKGASAALVSRHPENVPPDAPLLIVQDVMEGLRALARAARSRTQAEVVAITGSVGKTSTKEMLRSILARQGQVHVAEASYNNHWGVPLTLARLPKEADYAVIEIGMNAPGEIAPLAYLTAPDVAMITTVAPAHLQTFASVEEIAHEKASVYKGLKPGGIAILNADTEYSGILEQQAHNAGARLVRFGCGSDCDYRIVEDHVVDGIMVVRAHYREGDFLFRLVVPVRSFALNALGALAVVKALGADLAIAAGALGRWRPKDGRGVKQRIVLDIVEKRFFDLLDDAFNANPASMAVGLDLLLSSLPSETKGKRVAILGDMLELGTQEERLHAQITQHKGIENIAQIHCVGLRMKVLYAALPVWQRGIWVERAEDLIHRLREVVSVGDVILVKGSKGSRVSFVADAIRRMGQAASTEGDS